MVWEIRMSGFLVGERIKMCRYDRTTVKHLILRSGGMERESCARVILISVSSIHRRQKHARGTVMRGTEKNKNKKKKNKIKISSSFRPRQVVKPALHFVLLPEAPPVHLLHLELVQIDPVDRPHVDGQFPLHERDGAYRVVERVRDLDPAGGAEGVFGCFCAEAVDGQVGAVVVELDVFLERVDPEFGVLFGFWG